MSNVHNMTQVSRQLEQALAANALPARLSGLGTHLLQQLNRPMNISVAGFPGSGKTSIINMLLGWTAVPAVPSARIIEICYGPEARTIFELASGEAEHIDCVPEAWHETREIVRVRFELPEDALASRTYSEIRFDPAGTLQTELLDYLAQHSAITVWCSEQFNTLEQSVWSQLPDEIKDHGFLALTMADRQLMKGTLEPLIADLQDVVSEEFYGLYPVATLQALNARADRNDDTALWTQSGGATLLDAIEKQVMLGRSEDLDRAQMLLEQCPAQHNETNPSLSPDAVAQDLAHPPRDTAKTTLRKGLGHMQSCAEQLLKETEDMNGLNCAGILESCLASIRDVSELLDAEGAKTDPVLSGFLNDVQEGENMLLLLQLEQDEAATADAVSLMLQLKKEISIQAYA